MKSGVVSVNDSALIAMDVIKPAERATLLRTLEGLSRLPPEQWPEPRPRRLKPDEPLYGLEVTPDLYVFFSVVGPGRLMIEEIVRPQLLDNYFRQKAGSGTPR